LNTEVFLIKVEGFSPGGLRDFSGEVGGFSGIDYFLPVCFLPTIDKLIYHWPIKEEYPSVRQESRYGRFFPAATLERRIRAAILLAQVRLQLKAI
jgi:hypothetical protein